MPALPDGKKKADVNTGFLSSYLFYFFLTFPDPEIDESIEGFPL